MWKADSKRSAEGREVLMEGLPGTRPARADLDGDGGGERFGSDGGGREKFGSDGGGGGERLRPATNSSKVKACRATKRRSIRPRMRSGRRKKRGKVGKEPPLKR